MVHPAQHILYGRMDPYHSIFSRLLNRILGELHACMLTSLANSRSYSRIANLVTFASMQRLYLCLASAALAADMPVAADMPCTLSREAGVRCDGRVDDTKTIQTLLNNCTTTPL